VRLNAAGQPCFIEANPLPGMTPGWSDLCMIAEAEGLGYDALIGRILAPALRRLERARAAR
jgi:D-alanine-D-alanine ligase